MPVGELVDIPGHWRKRPPGQEGELGLQPVWVEGS
jgi:hypothetical protein